MFDARELIVRNYDAAKSELIADFFSGALGIEETSGFTMENTVVNRSLTDIELAIMRVMGPIIDDHQASRSMARKITAGDPKGRRVACVSSDAMRVIEDRYGRDPEFISAYIKGPPIALKSDAIVVADDPPPQLSEAEAVLARVVLNYSKRRETDRDFRLWRTGYQEGSPLCEWLPNASRRPRNRRRPQFYDEPRDFLEP